MKSNLQQHLFSNTSITMSLPHVPNAPQVEPVALVALHPNHVQVQLQMC
jgi:hypothetical protein